jgi:hypothetical protein
LWIFYSIRNIKSIYKEFEIMASLTAPAPDPASHLPSVGVFEYVAGEPGQCNVIVRAHVSPEKVFNTSSGGFDDEYYMVPPNVPVFSTMAAMKDALNSNGKRSRSGGSEGIPIVAHVPDDNLESDGKVKPAPTKTGILDSDKELVFVGVSVGSTMAGAKGPLNGRCVSIAVSGAMTIPKAEARDEPGLSNFGFGTKIRFIFGQNYGSTKLNIAMPVVEGTTVGPDTTHASPAVNLKRAYFGEVAKPNEIPAIASAHGRAVTAITTSPRDVRIHMH